MYLSKQRFSLLRALLKTPNDKLQEAHVKTSETVVRIMLILVIMCFFCIHTVACSSDKDLLVTASLALPLKLGRISFLMFVVIGPLILMLVRLYLQIYHEHALLLGEILVRKKLAKVPTVSHQDYPFVNISKGFVLYHLIPVAVIFFVKKASAIPLWGERMFFCCLLVVLIHLWFWQKIHVQKKNGF